MSKVMPNMLLARAVLDLAAQTCASVPAPDSIVNEAQKPAANLPVLAWDGKQWVRAMWVPRYGLEQGFDHEDDWTDYNEQDGNFYWPEGWYELQSHGGDAMYWHLTDGATHWMPLPPPPKDQS